MTFNQCTVTCTNNGRSQKADILHRTDKSLKVAIVGANITINLSRSDLRKPYVGNVAGMEFTTNG